MRSVSTPTISRKRGSSDKTKTAPRRKATTERKATTQRKTAPAAKTTAAAKGTKAVAKAGKVTKAAADGQRSITITVPSAGRVAGGLADAALLPVAVARRWLPAKGGLPLYVGLGLLGAADALEWPVAVGIGIGYAVLRRGGAMAPPSTARRTAARAA
ncbi:hypothetical protein AB0H07_26375 [Streptomyces sp. NPDC021354]|uniref:hypothetical protein n=1 Tax=unclassified Streptomyces TaxID=2593676 RepID=UPI00340D3E60